jgi:hypothetical protein
VIGPVLVLLLASAAPPAPAREGPVPPAEVEPVLVPAVFPPPKGVEGLQQQLDGSAGAAPAAGAPQEIDGPALFGPEDPALAPAAPAGPRVPAISSEAFNRVVELGFSVLGGAYQGVDVAAAARLTFVQVPFAFTTTLEIADGRTIALVGGGWVRPLDDRFRLLLTGVAGVDVTNRALAVVPALGARATLDWSTQPSIAVIDTLSVSLTTLFDLVHGVDDTGQQYGGASLSFTVGCGFTLGRRSRSGTGAP